MGTTAAPIVRNIDYPAFYILYAKPLEINLSLAGESVSETIPSGLLEIEIELLGELAVGNLIIQGLLEIDLSIHHEYVITGPAKSNFVKWSKIGRLDFTIDESNVAGERPLDWKGAGYKLLKLGNAVIAYGENGVTVMTPSGVNWGIQTIHRIGPLCKTAIVGTDREHYFIDRTDKLYKLTQEGLKQYDYSEFLANLTNPTLSLDIETGLLYICDGVRGYVFSTLYDSFGEGPINITGIGTQSGTLYVVGTGEIEIPKFHICTDIYDLGTRKPKTIEQIEVGTELTNDLQVMVEARLSNKANFINSVWKLVNPSGIAYLPCYGVEFKFHLRSYIREYIELDYIKVLGAIHGYSYLEAIE